jgi:hypothetical protein
MILNRSIDDITSKISCCTVPELTGQELYSESSIAGYQALLPNTDGEPTQIDLELLFNATIINRQVIEEIFN